MSPVPTPNPGYVATGGELRTFVQSLIRPAK